MPINLLNEIRTLEKHYLTSSYSKVAREAIDAFLAGNDTKAIAILELIPNQTKLFDTLVESLKGKSVYKTLRKISKGEIDNTYECLKGLYSLGTHIAIECEKGNSEYGCLFSVVNEKISKLL
jgi:hypothetical protein